MNREYSNQELNQELAKMIWKYAEHLGAENYEGLAWWVGSFKNANVYREVTGANKPLFEVNERGLVNGKPVYKKRLVKTSDLKTIINNAILFSGEDPKHFSGEDSTPKRNRRGLPFFGRLLRVD